MVPAEAPATWRDLVQVVSRGRGAGDALADALPILLRLVGATSALVLRQHTGSWQVALCEGEELTSPAVDEALTAAEGSSGPTAWRELPGDEGRLLLAWRGAPSPWTEPAVEVLLTGLGRLEAEERYSDLALRMDNAQMLANMGDYDWHIPTDSNTWSDQLYRIYGHEPQSFAMSYETFLGFIHPEDQGWIKQLHERAYATGEPYAMTERIVRPDGEVRYLSSNGQVLMGPEGQPVRMRGTCIDITDRVLAEQERERSAGRFATLVESSPDAILVMDGEGAVLLANGRAHDLLGGDPVGHRFGKLLPQAQDRPDGAVRGTGVDGRALLLDVTMADLSQMTGEGEVAAFLHDAVPRLRNESLAAALREGQVRRRQAMEINDNVVQGLSTALYAMRDSDRELAISLLDRTLHAARQMMSDLLHPVEGEDIKPGDLVRSTPSRLDRNAG